MTGSAQRAGEEGETPGQSLDGYVPLPGVPDEAVAPDGRIRPLWQRLSAHLGSLAPDALATELARADQYLNDSGVFYRQYGGGTSVERPWPLSHVPVLLDQADWEAIRLALIQRADLLEAVMADLYGPNRLVAEGRLPSELVAGNREWLRPLVAVPPRSGYHLHFLAFELGRGPDGNWWVLSDRTQAPSGAGYALENRVATSRAFSTLYASENVHRLAGFFRDFRDALLAERRLNDSRVAILTPGHLNETYYEHAWIARYLGFTLVEGEDLVAEQGQIKIRTVSGLRPVEVLWRRLDASYADPLELDQNSRIGTPGLVSVLRSGGVSIVNSLGSGILETRALMAFLPRIAPDLLGESLRMPNIATWWCGDPVAAEAVAASPERMILSHAHSTSMLVEKSGDLLQSAAAYSPPDLYAHLAAHGRGLVAQEAVTLSTTPVLVGGKLVPRPMTLRVFLARSRNGWTVMPGGFARIGARPDPEALAMQRGGSSADVWVISPSPVPRPSMMPAANAPFRRAPPGALPSRAADNLFWLGRYIERTESILRLLRATNMRLAEGGAAAAPLLETAGTLFDMQGVDPSEAIPAGLLDALSAAIASAGRVRDRFSPDAWSALADLDKTARRMASRSQPGDDAARALSALLRKLAGISGLIHENMYRFMGWRFLTLGRLHERAINMAVVLAVLADPSAPDGSLDLAIEYGDSVMTHRRRFTVSTSRLTVLDLLGLDPLNPRSLRRQVDGMREEIDFLPEANEHGALSPLARAVLRLHAELATSDPDALTTRKLWGLRARFSQVSDLLTNAYFA